MNRIILIGNGFDLAHGLKTSYSDFIDWIIDTKFEALKKSKYNYEDDDIKYKGEDIPIYGIKDKFVNSARPNLVIINGDIRTIKYKNHFLRKLIYSKYIKDWADIETMFYDELNILLNDKNTTDRQIDKFNSDFQRIVNLLSVYLKGLEEESNNDLEFKEIKKYIYENTELSDLSVEFNNFLETNNDVLTTLKDVKDAKDLKNILLLDFNYTSTSKKYLKKRVFNSSFAQLIKIHGDVYDEKNPIIFGFGDELDENYSIIENSRLKNVFKYIKSINYLKTDNYRRVLRFLELDKFQVFIFGHSCGLTDRTLLNHIFEHNNCVSIKPFYRIKQDDSNNYIEIVSNIARNFTDKNKLRDRVVNFQYCKPLIK